MDKILALIRQQLISDSRRKLVIHADDSRWHIIKIILECMLQQKVRFTPYQIYPQT
jgi:hypothetical protein